MVRHWSRELRTRPGPGRRRACGGRRRSTSPAPSRPRLVLVLVLVTKFVHGAYIVVIAMPLLYLLMVRIRRHYDAVDVEAAPRPGGVVLPSRIHAVVPVVRVNEPTLRTLAFARAIHPDDLTAVTVRVDPAETDRLFAEWVRRDIPVPLTVIESPYRDVTQPLLDYVRDDPPAVAAGRRQRLRPRVRRRALVGGAAAQPERAAAEGPAAVPARRDGHQRAVAAARPASRRSTPRSEVRRWHARRA